MRRGIACVALATSALLLPACTSNDPPPTPTTSTPATTSPPMPTTPPPTPPPATRTPAGAEAFVRYFWQTYNYAFSAVDPEPLASISDKACKFCTSTTSNVADLKRTGSHVQGGEVIVEAVVAPPDKITEGTIVATVVEQKPGTTTSSTGVVKQIKGSAKRRSYVGVEWRADSWSVFGVTLEKPGT